MEPSKNNSTPGGAKLSKTERKIISFYLNLLQLKHPLVKEHCIRVALVTTRLAKILNLDTKAAYLGAIFHDLGKLVINSDLFSAAISPKTNTNK